MARSPFVLFALSVLSSSIPSSQGFSTSRQLSSSNLMNSLSSQRNQKRAPRESQRRIFDGSVFVLHVATDPSTITSHVDEDGGHSYDFISVEEAEEALQQERDRYEGERSELQWRLETQRQQLQDLADRQGEKEKTGDRNLRCSHGRGGDDVISSSRIVILGAHDAHTDATTMNIGKKNRKKGTRGSSRSNANGNDRTYLRMERLENLLQDAIVENEKLTRRLRKQHHQYNVESSVYADELREERGRLNCVRDELHMERAYFETSRRMLEHLLVAEQQKVRELEKELMIMISGERVFSQEKQSQEEYHEQQRAQYAQKEYVREESTHSQINNEKRHQQKKRGRAHADFTMNINDVQCPLYP